MSKITKNLVYALLLATCAYFAITFVFLAFSNFFPGPFNDYWADISNVEKAFQGRLRFDDLINAHNNAHRILIPRLLFILDYYFFQGSNLLIVFVCLLCKLVTWILFNHIIRNQSALTRLLLNTLIVAALLNADNIYNIIFSSNVQWDLMILFSVLAIYFYSCAISENNGDEKSTRKFHGIALGYLFFVLGFLSQAGALPVLFVFLFISLIYSEWRQLVINCLLTSVFLYLNFVALPVSDPESPTFQSSLIMMIFGPLTVLNFIIHLMASGIHWYIKTPSLYFSAYLMILLITSLLYVKRTRQIYHNVFFHIALCAFLMIIIIAAARSMFGPGQWAASRFHVVPLLFIPCLSLHAFLSAPLFFKDHKLKITQALIVSHSLLLLLMVHFYTYRDSIDVSNKVFNTHADMFAHERTQEFGGSLRAHHWEQDLLIISDPFFQKNSYVYYANKQGGNGAYQQFTGVGKPLLNAETTAQFEKNCPANTGTINYGVNNETGEFEFTMPLNPQQHSFFTAALFRNSWYAVDTQGIVTGFGFLFIEPERFYTRASLRGYSMTQGVRYIVDIKKGQARCLYMLSTP